MSGLICVYVVQSLNSGDFLCPYEGDVGFTPYLYRAGFFYDREEAVSTAIEEIGHNFNVFGFWVEQDKKVYL